MAERAPQIALLLKNQTSVVCSDYSQGVWELGPQREDEDLSVVWGLKGPLERREKIMTSQGLGIRIPGDKDLSVAWLLLLKVIPLK